MLDLDAAVKNRLQTRLAHQLVRGGVLHPDLLPQAFGTDAAGLLGQRQYVLRAAKDVDHVHRVRNVQQAGVHRLTQDLLVAGGVPRIHGDYPVAVRLQVLGDKKTGPVPLGRQADHSNGLVLLKHVPQSGVVVVHGLGTERFRA